MAKFEVFVILSITLLYPIVQGMIPCPSIRSVPGIIVSCETSKDNNTKIPCQGPINGVPRKTIAKYRCVGNDTFSENILECRCRGKWKGLEVFENYTSICTSIQKNFSLNGPSELNFNPDVMKDLTNIAKSNNVTEFAEDALAYHNYYRGLHGSNMLKLNSSLSTAAQKWAEKEVSNDHKVDPEPWTNRKYISNIYRLVGPIDFDLRQAARLAVGRWYQDIQSYDFDVPSATAFSSMIWNSTTELGVGIASQGKDVIVVCNYWPPGNVYTVDKNDTNAFDSLILFKKNVFPLLERTDGGRISMLVSSDNSTKN